MAAMWAARRPRRAVATPGRRRSGQRGGIVLEPTLTGLGLAADARAGEVAVVTGAGSGIGREVAIALAGCGAAVAIAEIAANGGETEQAIRQAGGAAFYRRTDVSREDDVAAFAGEVAERLGPATLLVNSAIISPVSALVDMEASAWDAVMAVNLRGAFLTCAPSSPR
jgi:NAD(P)-dependent dehydrogenase (short-subunit alcohol dehydrogenase family)